MDRTVARQPTSVSVVPLGELLAQGGQGCVYAVAGSSDEVVKVYNDNQQPMGVELERLDRLIAAGTKALRGCCAWPDRRVSVDGKVAFVMRRVPDSHELHMLIDRVTRLEHFQHANWKFMVHAAQNLARACERVHAAGLLIVDLSEKNVLVDRSANVSLIDCDGFVFQGGGKFGCSTTITLQWTAPELRGALLESTPRTVNHDNYALARAIFKLLFQGSEPMQFPHGDSDVAGERIFVFSLRRPARAPKPFELTLDALPPEVAELFEQAFEPASAAPGVRPTAAQWTAALAAMRSVMRGCSHSAAHSYVAGRPSGCPWCAMAAKGPNYDDFRVDAVPAGTPSPPVGGAGAAPPIRRRWLSWRVGSAIAAGLVFVVIMNRFVTPVEKTPEDRTATFVTQHFAIISDPRSTGNELSPRYAPNADVYDGKPQSQPGSWFAWMVRTRPNRSYNVVAESLQIACNDIDHKCRADVVVRYKARSGDGKHGGQGCWNYVFMLDMSTKKPFIISEKKGSRTAKGCPT